MGDPQLAADRAPGSEQSAARSRKLAADLDGTPDDVPTAARCSGRGEAVLCPP